MVIGSVAGVDVWLVDPDEGSVGVLADGLAAMEPWSRYQTGAKQLAGFLCAEVPGAQRYFIWVGNCVAGAVVVQPIWLRGPYLQFLGLLGAWQKRGIGRMVLDWLESGARLQGGNRHIWIMASEFNASARAFYIGQGYEEVALVPDVVEDGFGEVLLRKRL